MKHYRVTIDIWDNEEPEILLAQIRDRIDHITGQDERDTMKIEEVL